MDTQLCSCRDLSSPSRIFDTVSRRLTGRHQWNISEKEATIPEHIVNFGIVDPKTMIKYFILTSRVRSRHKFLGLRGRETTRHAQHARAQVDEIIDMSYTRRMSHDYTSHSLHGQ